MEIIASMAAMLFNLSFIAQVKTTWQTKDVNGLSLTQWVGFSIGSLVFVLFYIELGQYIMATVSSVGMMCCVLMVMMINHYSVTPATNTIK